MTPAALPRTHLLTAVCLVILISAGVLNWLAPMSSDDYSYATKGVSWDAIRGHYLGWSGRLVADTLSSLVLGWGSHWADAVNTLALLAMVWILSTLGQRLAGKASWVPDPRVLLFVFILYWVNNPRLGHTTFWIVGAANYLWTHALLFGFALAFVAVLQDGKKPLWKGLALAVLAVLAGCTNENTAPTAWLMLAWLGIQAERERPGGQSPLRTWGWPAFWLLCMAIGIAILVLSPGDLARAAHPSNREWYDAPLAWRIEYHLWRRFPDAMAKYWQAALVLLWGAACIRLPRAIIRCIGLLVALACIANLALVFAPAYPKRTLQGGFLFMLLAVAVMGHQAVQPGALRRPRLLALGLGLCALQWLVSFSLLVRAYYGTAQQDRLRVALIQQGIAKQAHRIDIPGYYFSPLLNSRDGFDTFFNQDAIAAYYGTQAEIVEHPVTGPYDVEHPPHFATAPPR